MLGLDIIEREKMTKKVLIYKDDFFSTKKYFVDLVGEGKTKTVKVFSTGFKTKKAAVECVKYWLPEAKIWYMKSTKISKETMFPLAKYEKKS